MTRMRCLKIIYITAITVLSALLAVIVVKRSAFREADIEPQFIVSSESSVIVPASEPEAQRIDYGVFISEVLPKNSAAYRDENGNFPDYIELYNSSDSDVDLSGWTLSDKGKSDASAFGNPVIGPGEYLLIYADGTEADRHVSFSLSDDETVTLFDPDGNSVNTLTCGVSQRDAVIIQDKNGSFEESLYPTPGFSNDPAGYEEYQQTLVVQGPISINEAVVSNRSYYYKGQLYDWVEIKNTSGSPVLLSDYYLSDNSDDLHQWSFPDCTLGPGETAVVFCDEDGFDSSWKYVWDTYEKYLFCTISLGSLHDKLFLSKGAELIDYVSLKDIPYNCSLGRLPGENGFFYFETPSPMSDNSNGYRYVASKPVSISADGVFSGVDAVTVELDAKGEIFYTLDGSVPTQSSTKYTEPFSVSETTIVRAVSFEPGAMVSRAATFSYFINEEFSLPIVSLVVDDAAAFSEYWRKADKTKDVPANVAFYEEDGSFNLGCTVKFTGDASLTQNGKRGMRVKFRGAFGADTLHYDLFDGSITDFSSLSLRTGNDNILTYVRNEVAQDLSYEFTDNVISQHGRYCIVYLNGEYVGLYCLKEKICRQYVATINGVSKDSVEITEMEDVMTYGVGNAFYNDVYAFITRNDMSDPDNYAKLCEVLDVDSLIDWFVLQGQCGNWDMIFRNISFYRSSETDGKWRLIFYDLDRAYKGGENDVCIFANVFSYNRPTSKMIPLNLALMKNAEYKEKFTKRCAQALTTVYTDENILEKLDARQTEVAPGVEKDCVKWGRTYSEYQKLSSELRDYIQYHDKTKIGYCQHSINVICSILQITEEEFLSYAKG